MKLLMIDTSTIVATAAVLDVDRLIAETIVNYKKKHSEKMLPSIDHMLQDSGLGLKDFDVFGVVNGPGSFTGLRIGMATAKGFAQALNKPMVTVSTLEALAANVCASDSTICPIIDAQRGQVYVALYQSDGESAEPSLKITMAEGVYDVDTLSRKLKDLNQPVMLLGDGLKKYGKQLLEAVPNACAAPAFLAMNRASSAAYVGLKKIQQGKTVSCFQADLNYLRKSSAEEQREKKLSREAQHHE